MDIANPENVKGTFIFKYSSQVDNSIMQELFEAEGEDDIDLDQIKPINKEPEVNENVEKMQDYLKQLFQTLFDGVLRKSNGKQVLSILKAMNIKIFPKVANPLVFSDFIISAYDLVDIKKGAKVKIEDVVISIHALSSLFILMTNHGLDYTSINYYVKLYGLLDYFEQIFKIKEKEKFLRLLELSIKSPMLPSAIAASFIKKVLRIIVTKHVSESTTLIWVIAFVCNVIKKHPSLTKMINQPIQRRATRIMRIEMRKTEKKRDKKLQAKIADETEPIGRATPLHKYIDKDVFDFEQEDPIKAKAIGTCLWEFLALLNHSIKAVRDYACVILSDFQSKRSLPSDELAKLDEFKFINSQMDEVSKVKIVKAREIETIAGIYDGEDEFEEREFEHHKQEFFLKQIRLFPKSGSLLTKKF